jgi:type VI secretion system secreted protein Hcp
MAAVDYFLKIDGIEGESQDSQLKNFIIVQAWSWGETQSASGHSTTGLAAGRVSMENVHVSAQISKASPKLMLACANGQHFPKATLVCRKAGGEQAPYMTLKLSEVLMASYHTGGNAGSEVIPVEQFSLAFAGIEMEYKEQKPDGTMGAATKTGWDIRQNRKV